MKSIVLSTVAVHCKVFSVDIGPGTLGPDRSKDMTDGDRHQPPGRQLGQRGPDPARHGADAFGYKANLRIDRKLAQLLRLRVSQINNSTYCLNLHYQAARDAGIPRPVIDPLTAWWETDFHDDAARAAFAYTEAITRVADATVADDFGARHDALAAHFSQEEILKIIGIVINMNVWTRLKQSLCLGGSCPGRRLGAGARVADAREGPTPPPVW
jgi:AhpD family alkylhydroperoxidase